MIFTRSKIDIKLNTLRRELNKLEATSDEKPISRRNARKRVLAAMRALRAQVDDSFPAIVKSREGITRRTPEKRIKALKRDLWREVQAHDAGRFAALGIQVKRVAWTTESTIHKERNFVPGKGWVYPKPTTVTQQHERLFVPAWAFAIGFDPARLREAKKSVKARSAAIVAEALGTP